MELRNTQVWIADDAVNAKELNLFADQIQNNHNTIATQPYHAVNGIFVVKNPARAHVAALWSAALGGGSIVSSESFLNGGRSGSAVTYKPAVATARDIWMSVAFAEENELIAEIIFAAMNDPASKWKIVAGSPADYQFMLARPGKLKPLAIVSTMENANDVTFRQQKTAHDAASFLKFVSKVDMATSGTVRARRA